MIIFYNVDHEKNAGHDLNDSNVVMHACNMSKMHECISVIGDSRDSAISGFPSLEK